MEKNTLLNNINKLKAYKTGYYLCKCKSVIYLSYIFTSNNFIPYKISGISLNNNSLFTDLNLRNIEIFSINWIFKKYGRNYSIDVIEIINRIKSYNTCFHTNNLKINDINTIFENYFKELNKIENKNTGE